MTKILKSLKMWATKTTLNTILFGLFSTIIVALPFVATIFLIVHFTAQYEVVMMLLSLLNFIGFIVSYIFFTKMMNKK